MSPLIPLMLGPAPGPIITRAVDDLSSYLSRLFGIKAQATSSETAGPRLVIGTIDDPHVRRACEHLPPLSTQGHLLRRVESETLILTGGSEAAVAWAIYQLAETYGVRFLLHEDVLPSDPGPFHLPTIDRVFEPVQRIRSWRQFNDLAHGPVLWSLDQQRTFIDQIFKLKFNGVEICLWPQHPALDYTIDGIRRSTWVFLFDQDIPIDENTIGRDVLWPGMDRLTHPDFVGIETFDDALLAGQRLLGGILDLAEARGMHTAVSFQPMEFPIEFRPCLQKPTEAELNCGGLTCAETANLDNPKHVHAVETRIEAIIEQWGRADEFTFHLPEHPQADAGFARAWATLAKQHGLEPQYDAETLIDTARNNHLITGGTIRAERELKSAVGMVQFLGDFFAGNNLLAKMHDRDITLTLSLGGSSEPLFPFIHRVLPPGFGMRTNIDYTTSRAVRRLNLLEKVDTAQMRAALTVTLQDDNVGHLPQVATENIALLLDASARHGWDGFYTRQWGVGDLDPTVAWLARGSWDATITPQAAHADHVHHVYGAEAVDPFCRALRMLEDATVILDLRMGPFFPVHNVMRHFLDHANPITTDYCHVAAMYESVQYLLDRVAALEGGSPAKAANLAYWKSRLSFATNALNAVRFLQEAGVALADKDAAERQHGITLAEQAVAHFRTALKAMAEHVRDDSDRGALAAYNCFLLREVAQEIDAVRARGRPSSHAS